MAGSSHRVLTLDIAPSVTGWAFGDLVGKFPLFGYWRMPEFGGEGTAYRAFVNEIYAAIETNKPTAIVIERPLHPKALVERTTTENVFRIITMRGMVWEAGDRLSVPVSGEGADGVRMELLGRCRWKGGSKAAKQEVVSYVRQLGLPVTDHNAADAVMVWLYVQRQMARDPNWSFDPLFRDAAD